MHQVVYYFGDDLDEGMAKFEYKGSDYKLTTISEILADEKYQRWLGEMALDQSVLHPFEYIRYRLKERGPIVILDKEDYSDKYRKGFLEEYEIETLLTINDKGELCRVDLRHSNDDTNKWDWWVVGGRWKNSFLLKPGAARINHGDGTLRLGLSDSVMKVLEQHLKVTKMFDDDTFSDGVDCAFWGEIDFEEIKLRYADQRIKQLEEIKSMVPLSLRLQHETFKSMLSRLTHGADIVDPKDRDSIAISYSMQPSLVPIYQWMKDNPFRRDDVDIALTENIEAHALEFANDNLVPYSFVYEGKWYSKDDFDLHWEEAIKLKGQDYIDHRKAVNQKWRSFYHEFTSKIPPKTIVTCVDIHY